MEFSEAVAQLRAWAQDQGLSVEFIEACEATEADGLWVFTSQSRSNRIHLVAEAGVRSVAPTQEAVDEAVAELLGRSQSE